MPTAEPFVVLPAGVCSFCHRDRLDARTLVGVPMREASICDRCAALGWDLLAEFDLDPPGEPHRRGSDDVAFDERREQIDAISHGLANERASRRAVGTGPQGSGDAARVARARAVMPDLRCSFCDSHRGEVLKLISGPGTFICDECLESATAVIVDALRR